MNISIDTKKIKKFVEENKTSILIGIAVFLLLPLFFIGGGDNKIPGGGFGIFLVGVGFAYLAYISGIRVLWLAVFILGFIWIFPKIVPVAEYLGITQEGVIPYVGVPLLFLAGMIFWIWKKGSGALWWRFVIAVVIAFSLFKPAQIIIEGWGEVKETGKGLGVSLPENYLLEPIKRFWEGWSIKADGESEKFLADAEKGRAENFSGANKLRTFLLKKGPVYSCSLGNCSQIAFPENGMRIRIGQEEMKVKNVLLVQIFLPNSKGDLYVGAIEAYAPADLIESLVSIEEAKEKKEAEEKAEKEAKARAEKEAREKEKAEFEAYKKSLLAGLSQKEEQIFVPTERNEILLPKTSPEGWTVKYDLPPQGMVLAEDFEFKVQGQNPGWTVQAFNQELAYGTTTVGKLSRGTRIQGGQTPYYLEIRANGPVEISPLVIEKN